MKLYYKPGTCSLAVHIVLAWLDIPYELELADTRDPEFTKINYLSTVPVLFTEDVGALYQSSAILRYLSRLPAGQHLGPGADPIMQCQSDYWMSFFNSDVYRAFAPFFNPEKYTTDASLEAKTAIKSAVPAQVEPLFKRMDIHLATRDYYLEDERSIVDASAFVFCFWATKVLANGLADYPNVARHYDTLRDDPRVQKVMAIEGLVPR